MPIYVYETIPSNAGEAPTVHEFLQGMHDAPLRVHPDSGEPIRRVHQGRFGILTSTGAKASEPSEPRACGEHCCCR